MKKYVVVIRSPKREWTLDHVFNSLEEAKQMVSIWSRVYPANAYIIKEIKQ